MFFIFTLIDSHSKVWTFNEISIAERTSAKLSVNLGQLL